MRAFLRHLLRRMALVAIVLGTGLLGWPGDTGAQESLLNSGSIDSSGARRISITPLKSAEAAPQPGVLGEASQGERGDRGSFLQRAAQMMNSVKTRLGGGTEENAQVATGVESEVLEALKATGVEGINPDGSVNLATALRDLPKNMAIIDEERDKAMARAAAFGEMMNDMDEAQGAEARARREKAAAEKAKRPPTLGETLFAEFGAPERVRTPYEVSHAALAAQ